MPAAPGGLELRHVEQQPGIQQQLDRDPVARHGRDVAQGLVIGAPPRARRDRRLDRLLDIGARTDQHAAVVAVDDDDVALLDDAGRLGDPADDRNVERPRDDRDMHRRRALFEHEPLDPAMRVIQQLGRSHRLGDQDEFGRALGRAAGGGGPDKTLLQPVGEILQIVKPLPQIRVGDLHHAALGLVAHFLHRGFGGQTAAHRLGHAREPAAIGREHAIGFDDLAMLARPEPRCRVDQLVDPLLHRRDGVAQPPLLGIDILGDDMADHDVRLVQQRRSHRQARIEAQPAEPHRQRGAAAAFRHLVRVDQLAAGDQLRDDHRDRLQGLDLVLGILPPRPVLYDEDPEHALAAQHRHAHQRMVDLLAGFGAIGEIGVGLRVGQRQRARGGGDPPDETLADPEPGAMHRLGAQPLGREQFEHLAGPHHIGRADLGDHFGGDDADDLVEPFLGRARAGHDAAQTAQQPASRRDRLGRRVRRRGVRGLGGALLDDLAHSETAPAEQPRTPAPAGGASAGTGPGARRSRPAPDRQARRECRRCSARASPCRRSARPSASRLRHRRRSPRGAAPRPRNARFRAARPFATARRG